MPLPGAALGWAGLVVPVAGAAQAPVLLAGAGQAAQLAVLVHGVADPVDAGVLWGRQAGTGEPLVSPMDVMTAASTEEEEEEKLSAGTRPRLLPALPCPRLPPHALLGIQLAKKHRLCA